MNFPRLFAPDGLISRHNSFFVAGNFLCLCLSVGSVSVCLSALSLSVCRLCLCIFPSTDPCSEQFTQPQYLSGYPCSEQFTQPQYLSGYPCSEQFTQPQYLAGAVRQPSDSKWRLICRLPLTSGKRCQADKLFRSAVLS